MKLAKVNETILDVIIELVMILVLMIVAKLVVWAVYELYSYIVSVIS
jgi:hypothetical protein